MRKAKKSGTGVPAGAAEDILPEHDCRKARRNKYASRYRKGALVVTLDPHVAKVLPTADEANEALRSSAKAVRSQRKRLAR